VSATLVAAAVAMQGSKGCHQGVASRMVAAWPVLLACTSLKHELYAKKKVPTGTSALRCTAYVRMLH
jgi:hypothetical protein